MALVAVRRGCQCRNRSWAYHVIISTPKTGDAEFALVVSDAFSQRLGLGRQPAPGASSRWGAAGRGVRRLVGPGAGGGKTSRCWRLTASLGFSPPRTVERRPSVEGDSVPDVITTEARHLLLPQLPR